MDTYLKGLDEDLKRLEGKFADELRGVRSGRPSVEAVEHLKVNYFEQLVPVNQLATLSVVPPREIRISVWDKAAVAGVAKAIDDAQAGFSVAVEGNTIHANLPALSSERREELMKQVKKMMEGARIEVRGAREDALKKVKAAEDGGEMTEDDVADAKAQVQKRVDAANAALEAALQKKITELGE